VADSHLSDRGLEELMQSEIDDPAALQYILRLAAERGSFSQAAIDHQLKNWVFVSLEKLQSQYEAMFAYFWECLETAKAEFARYVADFAATVSEKPSETDPPWPWPVTEPPVGSGRETSPDFPNRYSGLWLCGYRIGKNGLPQQERERLLDHFFRNELPATVADHHGDEYGEPGSEQRLSKMSNVMASNCRNFQRNDRTRYAKTISDYESDVSYLKARYYKQGWFPWPPLEP